MHPLPEYPRPSMRRDSYVNLNGPWDYAITQSSEFPAKWDGAILVPYSPEAKASGVSRTLQPGQWLHYHRTFTPPAGEGGRVLLHFGAVDYACAVEVNGRLAGGHRGGYWPFTLDITDLLRPQGHNTLWVAVQDPTGAGIVVRGDGQGLDVVVRHPLQPDGLPDAALGRVEHPAGLERLLAPRLVPGAGGVLHGHPQAVVVGVQRVGDVERKGPVAAPVAAHQMPVDLHRAGVIHGPEVEQHPAALPRGWGKAAVVVEPLAGPERPPHAGGFCLRGVGHQDVAVPLGRELGRFCDGVLPHTVQALEAVPPQRGAGVFRQRVLGSR